MWKPPPDQFFEVKPLQSAAQWGIPQAWANTNQSNISYQSDPEKKKSFGIALAKQGSNDLQSAFKAGCEVFPDNTNAALWVAHNWLNDIIVIASRDLYADSLNLEAPILDKDQFAARVLQAADEKIENNGKVYHAIEAKDRLGFLRLYAEIKGYVGKTEINNNLHFNHNEMKIKLVKPSEEDKPKIIDTSSNEELTKIEEPRLKIKLVK